MFGQERLASLVTSFGYYAGRFEILLGLVLLGLATIFLRLNTRRNRDSRDMDRGLRLLTTMLVGAIMILLTRTPSRNPRDGRARIRAREAELRLTPQPYLS